MARFFPQQSSVSAAVRLAERLLAEAHACPELIIRSEPAAMDGESREHFPALALLADPVLDVRPYLEHLVRIAAASAQRSEALAEQARRRSRGGRRQLCVVGCLGTVGLLIGVIGLVASHNSDAKLTQVRGQLIALTQAQQRAQSEIAALAARKSDARAAEVTARGTTAAPKSAAASEPALQAHSIRYYAQPWPDSRRSARAPQGQVTDPHFVAGFE